MLRRVTVVFFCAICAIGWGGCSRPTPTNAEKEQFVTAAEENDIGLAERLLRRLSNRELIDQKDDMNSTVLHQAAYAGSVDVAKLLVSRGADIEAKNTLGWTPLIEAVNRSNLPIVQLLTNKGADVNVQTDDKGWTPLHFAAIWAQPEIAELLMSKGANVNARTKKSVERQAPGDSYAGTPFPAGITPLTVADMAGRSDMAELLRKHGGTE